MIQKSILGALLLLIAYEANLRLWPPRGNQTLTYSQGNLIRAQRQIYGAHSGKVMFLGSSLTVTLEPYLQRGNASCLALAGMGVRDGLRILEHMHSRPPLLMIEINRLQRQPNQEFLQSLLASPFFEMRGASRALRHEYQPANLFVPWLEQTFQLAPRELDPDPSPRPRRRLPPQLNNLSRTLEQHQREIEDGLRDLPGWSPSLQELRGQGVPIAFYEIPEVAAHTQSSAAEQLRQQLRGTFPSPLFGWVPLDRSDSYYTYDGQHLCDDDAYAYARYLLGQIEGRPQSSPRP
jgi:hypothetical protein